MIFFKYFFKRWPLEKQASFLKEKGILIGSRARNDRKIFVYMYQDIFAEILFEKDNPDNKPQLASIVTGLKNLNQYLENDFRQAF